MRLKKTNRKNSIGFQATSEFIETGIGRIELFEELGQGAYGVVRRCNAKIISKPMNSNHRQNDFCIFSLTGRVVATGRHCAVKIEISKVPVLHMEEVFYKALGEHRKLGDEACFVRFTSIRTIIKHFMCFRFL